MCRRINKCLFYFGEICLLTQTVFLVYIFIRDRQTLLYTYCPSLKYSLRVLENLLEYLTNSLFLCSRANLPCEPGM